MVHKHETRMYSATVDDLFAFLIFLLNWIFDKLKMMDENTILKFENVWSL